MFFVAAAGWILPGGGYFLLKENKRATIILFSIVLTFCLGLYIGSIGVVDPVNTWPYLGQMCTTPIVAILGHYTVGGQYDVYGKPNEIGQIYTVIAGLLNLLCIVNSVQMAHVRSMEAGN